MSPTVTAILLLVYFAILILISYLTSRKSTPDVFFLGKRTATWPMIAFGMLGVSLSGISVISVPGWVLTNQFHYLQMVLGYVLGYYAIAYILLPVYYRLKRPSIYSYLQERLGGISYKTSAALFLINRTVVASFRLYVVATVLHSLVFEQWGIPYPLTIVVTLLLIWLYTYRAGIQTIIWTDIFQTSVMILTLVLTVYYVSSALDFSFADVCTKIAASPFFDLFEWDDWRSQSHFLKMFLAGAFIPIVMTGLDQDMMQKNLGCKTLKDAQKNMIVYGYGFLPINLILLALGVLLALFLQKEGLPLPTKGDELYPHLATNGMLPPAVGILFTLAIIAATFSSADSALTALTTSFTLDILNLRSDAKHAVRIRNIVHLGLSFLIMLLILAFRWLNEGSVISALFTAVSYLYGPLLGFFAFGLFTPWQVRDRLTPLAALLGPLLSYFLSRWMALQWGYTMGYELLIVNAALTFALLSLIRKPALAK